MSDSHIHEEWWYYSKRLRIQHGVCAGQVQTPNGPNPRETIAKTSSWVIPVVVRSDRWQVQISPISLTSYQIAHDDWLTDFLHNAQSDVIILCANYRWNNASKSLGSRKRPFLSIMNPIRSRVDRKKIWDDAELMASMPLEPKWWRRFH